MRLLIVGPLEGQLGTAGKIAMARGAKVAHADDIEQRPRRAARAARAPIW